MKEAADLLPRFLGHVADLPRSEPCVIALSGGVDSVVLFDLLQRSGFSRLVIAHFHHGLRGKPADRDEKFVRDLAEGSGMIFVRERGQTRSRAEKRRESIEEAARKLRRAFLTRTAKRHGASIVFLGHHAGDAAETVLFHLGRGGGARGLSSMRARVPLDATGMKIIRPLLGFTRRDIEAHAKARKLTFCEDETNASRGHTRNRLRHDVIPALAAALGLDPVPALARAAEILAAEDDMLEESVRERAQAARIEVQKLRREPMAMQRRWLKAWLHARIKGDVSFDTIERARVLALSKSAPAKMNLPRGFHLRRREGILFVERASRAK